MNISQRLSLNLSSTVYPFSITVRIYYLSSLLLLVLCACIYLLSCYLDMQIWMVAADVSLSTFLAGILYLLVEAPSRTLVQLLFSRMRSVKTLQIIRYVGLTGTGRFVNQPFNFIALFDKRTLLKWFIN